jgi:glycosyltransferase involved in cell wall biosynthesis
MTRTPVLSLCICSHAGAASLEDALASLVGQSAPAEAIEIVVVDNASGDAAKLADLVERQRGRVPIRLVAEPRLGLSHARNRAVSESVGEYLFFMDDDAVAAPRLVEHLLCAIAEHAPDVLGGNVLPWFEAPPRPELGVEWWPWWSAKHFGERDRWLDDGEYFLGTNVAAARRILEVHPFDPELGRRGDGLRGGEEWYLGDARFRRRFVAAAVVFHRVGAERQGVDYLARRLAAHRGRPGTPARRPAAWRWIARELGLLLRRLRFTARVQLAARTQHRSGRS